MAIPPNLDAARTSHGGHLLSTVDSNVHRTVDIRLTKAFGGTDEDRDFPHPMLLGNLKAFHIRDKNRKAQASIVQKLSDGGILEHLATVCKLGNDPGRHHRRQLDRL